MIADGLTRFTALTQLTICKCKVRGHLCSVSIDYDTYMM